MLKVFECFSGYGSQSLSLRDINIDYKVVGISEIDPDAIIAYGSLRFEDKDNFTFDNISIEEMKNELIKKNIGKDFKTGKSKILNMHKEKIQKLYKFHKLYNNFGDISLIQPKSLPDFNYMTYSFPCTDLSISGRQEGFKRGKTRSSLLYECEKIIEEKKPKYLLMENVKALISKKFKKEFDEWCDYLKSLGYKNFYKVLNAKNFGIPQNRERVFMVSILDDCSEYNFSDGVNLDKKIKNLLENNINEKYFLSNTIQERFEQKVPDDGKSNIVGTTAPPFRKIGQRDVVYGLNSSIMGCLMASDFRQPKQILYYDKDGNKKVRKLTPREYFRFMGLCDLDIDKLLNSSISKNALYRLAGNSIVKQCLDVIHKNLFN